MVVEAFVFFLLLHLNSMLEARPLLCSEIDMQSLFEGVIFFLEVLMQFPY